MSEFPVEPSVEIARRLEIRGDDSSSWIAVLLPPVNPEVALDGLRDDLSSMLSKETRVLNLMESTFEQLHTDVHRPADDVVILTATTDLTPDKWASVDLMRSALERKGPVVLWMSSNAFGGLSEFAPNIRSFIGASIFTAAPDGSIMTEQERQKRLEELVRNYGQTNEEIIRKAEANELPAKPNFIEWLVLLGRGDLV